MELLEEEDIPILEWPAYSPDVNPIENVWGFIQSKLRGLEMKNKDDLWNNVTKYWTECYMEHSKKLSDSLPTRIRALIKAKGGHLKY